MAETQEKIIQIAGSITVDELAEALGLSVTALIGELFKQGIMATINQRLDFDTASLIIDELKLENVRLERKKLRQRPRISTGNYQRKRSYVHQ